MLMMISRKVKVLVDGATVLNLPNIANVLNVVGVEIPTPHLVLAPVVATVSEYDSVSFPKLVITSGVMETVVAPRLTVPKS